MSTPQKNQPLRSAKQSLAVLANAFKQIGGCSLFAVYGAFLLVCCALFCILEPETFPVFGNAVWYSFQAITTIGFGDIVAHTTICRVITILMGLSSLVVVALIIMFFDEHMRKLTELSPDELSELERKYHDFTKGHRR